MCVSSFLCAFACFLIDWSYFWRVCDFIDQFVEACVRCRHRLSSNTFSWCFLIDLVCFSLQNGTLNVIISTE